MLYTVTVLDTDEHPPTFGSSAKYNNAHEFGTFTFEAPAVRRFGRKSRVPEALIEAATTVSMQYLTSATHEGTVLVEIAAFFPKRIGYGRTDTGWTVTSPLTSFLLSSAHMRRRDEGSVRRLAVVG